MTVPALPEDDAAAAEVGRDLHRALNRQMDYMVRWWRALLADLERRQRGDALSAQGNELAVLLDYTRYAVEAMEEMSREDTADRDQQTPAELDWSDIMAQWTRDEAAGLASWERVKQTARDELAIGKTGVETVEGYDPQPFKRAQYLAVRQALADGLQPGNAMEWLLIDGMAQAWCMHQQWLHKHVLTESLNVLRVERDAHQHGEWQAPRLSDAEAIDRAALMADRFQRQFLRLLKTYRDQRRLLGNVVVAAGGQLNVAEQQINVAACEDEGST